MTVETLLGIDGKKPERKSSVVVNKINACTLGLTQAIIFQRISFWTRFNKMKYENNVSWKERLFHDDCWWMFSDYEDFTEDNFPFLHKDTVRKAVDSLVKRGLVMRGNFNRRKGDRTTWLSINEKEWDLFVRSDEYQDAIVKHGSGTIVIHKFLARSVGLNESLVLRSIQYWTDQNQARWRETSASDNSHYYEGKWWMFNTNPDWVAKAFPFWSVKVLEKALRNLESARFIESLHKWTSGGRHGKIHSINLDEIRDYLITWEEVGMPRAKKYPSPLPGYTTAEQKSRLPFSSAQVSFSSTNLPFSSAQVEKSPTLQVATEVAKRELEVYTLPAADAAGTVNFSNSQIQDTKNTGSNQSVPENKQSTDSSWVVNALPEVTYLVPPDQPAAPAVRTRRKDRTSDWSEWVRAVLKVFDKEHLFDGTNFKDPAIGHFVKVASVLRKISMGESENQQFAYEDVFLMGAWLKSRVITPDSYRNTSPQIFLNHIAEFIWNKDEIKADAAHGKFDKYQQMEFGCSYG